MHDVCGPSSPSSSISAISLPAALSPYIFLPHTTISQEKRRRTAEPRGEGRKISSWETNLDASPPLLPLLSLPLPLSLWMVHSGIEKVLSTLFSLLLSLSSLFPPPPKLFSSFFLIPDSGKLLFGQIRPQSSYFNSALVWMYLFLSPFAAIDVSSLLPFFIVPQTRSAESSGGGTQKQEEEGTYAIA